MTKHASFQLNEQKIRDAFETLSPQAGDEQWAQLQKHLDVLATQRKNSLRQKIQRLGFIIGLVVLGGSLVAFIKFNKNSSDQSLHPVESDEAIIADKFSAPNSILVMTHPVAEPMKKVIVPVDSASVAGTDSLAQGSIAEKYGNVAEVKIDSAAEIIKKQSPPEPKKKKKRKKKKRRPAAHNASDDDVIISG